MGVPLALGEPHAERAEALLLEGAISLAQRQRLGLRVPALGEVPEPLAAAAPDNRDLPVDVQRLEHQPDVALAVPAVVDSRVRPVLELPR
jgi:hypothetical protein